MLLQVKNLHYSIDGKKIIENLSFDLPSKGITAVLGANGTGKSTLLSLISGLLQPEEGEILFERQQVIGPDYKLIPGHPGIALVRQDMRLTPYATVRENLSHILRSYDNRAQLQEINKLSKLLGFEQYLDKTLKYLSGGEQQRISIAAALATSPTLLLMDEPFSQTDINVKFQLKNYLREIVRNLNISIVFVTHDSQEALSLADYILIIHNGNIIEEGESKQLYQYPATEITANLTGYCNWLSSGAYSKKAIKVGSKYLLRPDQIRIYDQEKKHGAVKAIIIKIEFTGPYYLLYLRVEFETKYLLAISTSDENKNFKPDQTVYLEL